VVARDKDLISIKNRKTTKLTRNFGSLFISELSCKASETMSIAINMRSLCFFNAVKNIQNMKMKNKIPFISSNSNSILINKLQLKTPAEFVKKSKIGIDSNLCNTDTCD